ncbi:hypothetical protein CLCR_00429 [Cladophialophora carrionii]|uniref:Glycosyl transferase family 25 domain-containing protein n=1 Tax=Cladophialophora carrionii TaxID=86049 RepID=A0A1C1CC52_9EURO|nr:hypothetical protein CLCR_00429 [Cladophialophora carrionii]
MFPRFEVAGFAITLVIVFLFCSRFKPAFPDLDPSVLKYEDEAPEASFVDDVEPPNPFEDAEVGDVFSQQPPEETGVGKLADTMNSTLGFGKVFVISMPDRADKRDAFSLQARLSNITFQVRDGVPGADVPAKALPLDAGATGCWRAHLNIMQEMVRENIQSALVFEDDADWDVAIKYQMLQAARATRFVTGQPEDAKSISPYGDDWDIIWFGHCAANTDPEHDRRFVVTDDPTVLPPWSRSEFIKPDMSAWEEDSDDYLNFQTRIYFKSSWNSCTAAYAISLRGAEKVVFTESMVPYNDPVDNGMGAMCNQHFLDFTCIAPFPTVVGISKPAGPSNRGSDIRGLENDQVVEQGWSERLMYSTRQNIPRILTGEEDFVSVFGRDDVASMSLKDIGSGTGHGEWVWAGTRYFNEDEYKAVRDTDLKQAEAEAGQEEGIGVGVGDWQSPIEPEREQDEHEVEDGSVAITGEQDGGSKEVAAEMKLADGAGASGPESEREPDSEREMLGLTPELLEAQPQ